MNRHTEEVKTHQFRWTYHRPATIEVFLKGRTESMFVFPGASKDNTIGIQGIICHLVSLLLSEIDSEPHFSRHW